MSVSEGTAHHSTAPPLESERIFLALGSNIGDRLNHLQSSVGLFPSHGIHPVRCSSIFESAAHVEDRQDSAPDFLNAVIEVRTTLAPIALLDAALDVERRSGRTRGEDRRWAPRTLDVDLIAFGSRTFVDGRLVVPHPRIADRRFVLQPFAEIAADQMLPPPFDATVSRLLELCRDPHSLRKVHPPEAILPYPHPL